MARQRLKWATCASIGVTSPGWDAESRTGAQDSSAESRRKRGQVEYKSNVTFLPAAHRQFSASNVPAVEVGAAPFAAAHSNPAKQ